MKPPVTYIAIAPGHWGKGSREKIAVAELIKVMCPGRKIDKRVQVFIYRFSGPGHDLARVTETGHIAYPPMCKAEELGEM